MMFSLCIAGDLPVETPKYGSAEIKRRALQAGRRLA
jgi:hypothetical protein